MNRGIQLLFGVWTVHSGLKMLGQALPARTGGHNMGEARSRALSKGVIERRMVSSLDERVALIAQMVAEGRDDAGVRQLAVGIVSRRCGNDWCVREGDDMAEIDAIFADLKGRYRYVSDPHGKDMFQSPARTLQFGGGDCLPRGTLLLNDKFELVPIEKLIIGQRIWGHDRWSEVKDVWWKGILPVDAVCMNNGSSFKATADHKVYVALCKHHPIRWENNGKSCSCAMAERVVERLTVGQLEEGMVLLQPGRLPFGTESMDPRRAYVEGLYISDGWSGHDHDFDISGRDGHSKEAQKREVEEICRALGIETTWFDKSIRIRDAEWALRVQQMGTRAPQKRALSIDLDEAAARELLRGIMADSGANTNGAGRTFTATSRELMLQVRLLHRMLGVSCGERYIVDHGGLGEHPIWRLQTRVSTGEHSQGKAPKLLRVKAIERDVMELPVYDLTTDDHYVYLPEADVTISQCDDSTILVCSCLGSIGFAVGSRVVQTKGHETWNHIYGLVGVPKGNPKQWIPVDLSVRESTVGWEPPRGMIIAKKDYVFTVD